MYSQHYNCLFEKWAQNSAPVLHTSSFWPGFSETNIAKFLSGTADNPEASRSFDGTKLEHSRTKILSFMAEVRAISDDEYACSAAYLAFEQERLDTLDLILADSPATALRLNDELFGSLEAVRQPDIMRYLKWYVQELKPASPGVAGLRDELLSVWNDVPADPGPITALCAEFDKFRLLLRPLVDERFGFVDELLDPFSIRSKLDSAVTAQLLSQALELILKDRVGNWTAKVVEGAPNVFIDSDQQAIVVPAGRSYDVSKVANLIIHEIGSHVTRAVNGQFSQERLASIGMAGYGAAEESFGVLLGAVHDKIYDPTSSFISFAVIDFAQRTQAHNFRAVHKLTQAFMTLRLNPTTDDFERIYNEQARLAFARVIRASRRGDGVIVDRSTTKYWRGLLLLKTYFDDHGLNDAAVDQFLLGKYDCLNPAQYQLIVSHAA